MKEPNFKERKMYSLDGDHWFETKTNAIHHYLKQHLLPLIKETCTDAQANDFNIGMIASAMATVCMTKTGALFEVFNDMNLLEDYHDNSRREAYLDGMRKVLNDIVKHGQFTVDSVTYEMVEK